MSTKLNLHREELKKLAYPAVEQFIAHHPEYNMAMNQSGSLSNTNYVIFGQRDQEPVIFKYFCTDERKERETYALKHFAAIGIVPRILAEDGPRLLVQSYIPGNSFPAPTSPEYAAVAPFQAGYTLGQAVAILTSVPLSTEAANEFETRFYEGLSLEQYINEIMEASWQIHHHVEAYSGPMFAQSLATIQASHTHLLHAKRILYHQDALNHHFVGSHFSGFFDLEMSHVGTIAMQIGSLWTSIATHNHWPAFAQGFHSTSNITLNATEFHAAKAFAHFLIWRYISRYGRWQGDATDTELYQRSVAQAGDYANQIELANKVAPED